MTRMDEIVGRLRTCGARARAWGQQRGLGWRHGAAAGGVLLAGAAVVGLASAASGARPAAKAGERLQIEIVQPVEPVFAAGPTMEVGTLVDGFDPDLMPASEPSEAAYDEPDRVGLDVPSEGGALRRFSSSGGHEGGGETRPDRRADREAYDRSESERRKRREPTPRPDADAALTKPVG